MTQHITQFEGSNAISAFRVQQLLPRLQAIHDRIDAIFARYVHLVALDTDPSESDRAKLAALLTYGEPYLEEGCNSTSVRVVVTPRFGTVSPWASKATDIAHNCGLSVHRVERLVEYHIRLKDHLTDIFSGKPMLSQEQWQQVAALLHDRMTENAVARPALPHPLSPARRLHPLVFLPRFHGGHGRPAARA